MIVMSKISGRTMHKEDKIAALRFMLTLPLGLPFGISALPAFVFEYIYEVGAMEDLPWMKWIDDDTGSRIYRWRRSEDPAAVYEMSKDSPLFRSLGINHLLTSLRLESIGVDRFEKELLKYCVKWPR
jgi:hypothetical protein